MMNEFSLSFQMLAAQSQVNSNQQPVNRAPPTQSTFQAKPANVQPNSSVPKQVPIQQNWNDTLNKDKAGQATNAEDFTKQFMSQMYGGSQQQQQQNHQNSAPKPQAPVQQNWNETLNKDKAGQATNAEDFTKQFMSQMYGGQPQQNSQQSTTMMQQQQMNRTTQHSTFQQKPGNQVSKY